MMEKSYNQYCPIAHALDIIGDRWTLLIIRDLFLGPKRFTDLANGLPGIGSNILAIRLKGLEQNGLVRRRLLPPPAASAVYELTPEGQTLQVLLTGLARWGGRRLGVRQPGQMMNQESVKLGLYGLLYPLAEKQVTLLCEVHISDTGATNCLIVKIEKGAIQISDCLDERDMQVADIVMHLEVEILFALVGGRGDLAQAEARGAMRFEGKPEAIQWLRESEFLMR